MKNSYSYLLWSKKGLGLSQTDVVINAESKELADLLVFEKHGKDFIIGDCRHIALSEKQNTSMTFKE